ncbi:hypothetical protein PMAYCL1PPCAC_06320, partial [Pristionchus mayeri]
LQRPEMNEKSWTITTPCQFVADGVLVGYALEGECETCRGEGNAEVLGELLLLLHQFPRNVTVEMQSELHDEARQLAILSIRSLNAKGDEEEDGEQEE